MVHVAHANVGSWSDHILQLYNWWDYNIQLICFPRGQPHSYISMHCPTNRANCFSFLDLSHHLVLFMLVVNAYSPLLSSILSKGPKNKLHVFCLHSGVVPVSRIEFVPESSVYWPIIGLGTRK